MPANPVGPGTFSKPPQPYSVTIAEDGKILVKKDDWLSKYSWALYGNFTTLDAFVRGLPELQSASEEIKGIQAITDVDEIRTGEYLIHVDTYLEWAAKRGKPPVKKPPPSQTPTKPGSVYSGNWKVANVGGIELPAEVVLAGGGGFLAFKNMDTGDTFYYFFVRAGLGFGVDVTMIAKRIKALAKSLGKAMVGGMISPSDYVPLILDPQQGQFAAKTLDLASLSSRCWSATGGPPGMGYSYEKLTFYSAHCDFGHATFKGPTGWSLPGGGVSFTGGFLVWIW